MKLIFTLILCISFTSLFSQFKDDANADRFYYKEIGDTIFINNRHLVPGDTLRLGVGSAPDKRFLAVFQELKGLSLSADLKTLPASQSNSYLIFQGRKEIKNAGFLIYQPLFYSPFIKKKLYYINFPHAIAVKEIVGF